MPFWPTSSDPWPEPQEGAFCFFFKQTRRKSAALEPLTGLLSFVVAKLWPENYKK